RREALLEQRAREDGHPAEDAAVIVDRRDLPRLPGDQHDLPVFPQKDGVAHVLRGIEADAVEVAFGLRGESFDERKRSGTIRRLRGLDQEVTAGFREREWEKYNS